MSTPFVQRVKVGAQYTNGDGLFEVVEVPPLGLVSLVDVEDDGKRDVGIDAFRRAFWLVREGSVNAPE
jgi:hypothetical protein